ncbi:sec-independent protein translocase protein TatA [Actinokineospora alba]|uniref:Sec-independent protein translocase protein TatA n=1 Tax=Actinokineospora alba TaxID=504798 RepID=A0A1H0GH38_9PSEU|nr:Sec-independent protein translocase subunit TatA [Actinokineospora alba]TDP69895.1 sec-independent protein translocase protein TatA [Actinokineospora alba]SDI06409.1 sec-independent protein translocase protein TatA [Actinokineospora alba]SDO06255.1 sec-independent protein translocase protein TatA [Actinokineospora alba]
MPLGPWEILIIAVVIILLFGAKKMPAMARSLGQSMRIIKAETKGMRADDKEAEPTATADVKPEPQQLPAATPQQTPEQLQKQIDELQSKLDKSQPHKNAS